MISSLFASVAAIGTGFMSTLYCVGPATLKLLGLGGTDFGPWFAEYRLYNVSATILLLGIAYFLEYGGSDNTDSITENNELSEKKNWGKIVLWISYWLIIVFKLTPEIITFVYNL